MELLINPGMSDWRSQIMTASKTEHLTVKCEPGTYTDNLNVPDRPAGVTVLCTDPNQKAEFKADSTRAQAMYIPRSPGSLYENIVGRGGKSNVWTGSQINGTTFRKCEAHNPLSTGGNNDCFKVSQTDGVIFEDCISSGWGKAGSGIDAVEVINGVVKNFLGVGLFNTGANHGIQIKVRSSNWILLNIAIENAARVLNIGDSEVHVDGLSGSNCSYGCTFYDAANCSLKNFLIRNFQAAAFGFYATSARLGEFPVGSHYKNIAISDGRVEMAGRKDAWWIGDSGAASVHQLETYSISNVEWLNTLDASQSIPVRPGGEGIQVNGWTYGDGAPQVDPPGPGPGPDPNPDPEPPTGVHRESIMVDDGWTIDNVTLRRV